jgi:hypothetical protein
MLPGSRAPRAREAMTKSAVPTCRGAISLAIAAARHHLGAGGARRLAGVVARTAVGDDDAADHVAGDFGDHRCDRLGFVEGRNDDDHAAQARRRGRVADRRYRLHRSPQLAQASGGWSDFSALRNAS